MNEDKKITLIILSFPLAALLIFFLAAKVKFDLSLSSLEKKIYYFNEENTPKIVEKTSVPGKAIKNPIGKSRFPEKGFPATPLLQDFPPLSDMPGPEQRVSLIIMKKNSKMAIIDGRLLHEGDAIGRYRVSRIEREKILLKDKEGEKWLTLE